MKHKLPVFLFCLLLITSCAVKKGHTDDNVGSTAQLPSGTTIDDGREINIPVIFHVLYKNDAENVSEASINAMLLSLQEDFNNSNTKVTANRPATIEYQNSDSKFRFNLAKNLPDGTATSGIIRKKTTTNIFKYQKRKAFAESPPYDPYHYLNVYICKTNTGAYTPVETANHGIVIHYSNVNHKSKTLTHETGHWLGLRHIFEGKCNNSDGIDDTKAQKKFFGDQKYPYTSCTSATMVTNFMGYNETRDFFTPGQIKAMRQFAMQYMKLPELPKDSYIIESERYNVYGDVLKLMNTNKSSSDYNGYAKSILSKYDGCQSTDATALISKFSKSKHKYDKALDMEVDVPQAANSFNWQATVINELSLLIAKQFEKEMFHLALHRFFKDVIEPDTDTSAKIVQANSFYALFPQTTDHIRKIYESGNSYTGLDIASVQLLIKEDLKELPVLLREKPELLLPKINDYPKVKDMITLGDVILTSSAQGYNLQSIINKVSAKRYTSPKLNELTSIAAILSNALLPTSPNETFWLDPITQLDPESPEEWVTNTYTLLYNQLSCFPCLKSYLDRFNELERNKEIQKLLLFVRKLNDSYKFIESKGYKLETLQDQLAYVKLINDSFYELFKTVYKNEDLNKVYELNEKIIRTSGTCISIFEALTLKEYPTAITQIVSEFGAFMQEDRPEYKLLLVAAQIAGDKDGTQIKNILKTYIEPIGTSSQKRISPFNISLNSYAGITGGYESIDNNSSEDSFYAGVTAPIGISFSFMPRSTGSVSLFLELIDLGSLVNTRFKGDNTTYAELRFEHFLTPGIGLFYNFNKTPVTVGAKYNYISNLREIKYEDGSATASEVTRGVSRYSFSILIDIPLLTLYSKTKK